MSKSEKLVLIMPVYNEHEVIIEVLNDWLKTLDGLAIDFEIHVYNDGSKDCTLEVLRSFASDKERVQIHDKMNSGHGPTILTGYRNSCDNADWIFQIDSDNEMRSPDFPSLWVSRFDYDFLIGARNNRKSPLPRKMITLVSRLVVRACFGSGIRDVNSPYRLMRAKIFKSLFSVMSADTFAPNLIVSGFAARNKLRILEIDVQHTSRQTGEVSIKKWKLLKAALRASMQTIQFAIKSKLTLLSLDAKKEA